MIYWRKYKSTRVSLLVTMILLSGWVFPAMLSLVQGSFAGKIAPRSAADSPILVDGNEAWVSVPGITGDGSSGNPYVIKDKIIDAGGSGDGIRIQNTTKYFTIHNCTVINSAAMPIAGIHLANVTYGLIEKNNCSANGGAGIFAEVGCKNITIRQNNVTGNQYGIMVYDLSANVTVLSNNASTNHWQGIGILKNCTAVHVENNSVSNNDIEGIVLADNVTLSTFICNNISGNGVEGLYVYGTFNSTFTRNYISGNQFRGVIISEYAGNNTFDENSIVTNIGPGLEIYLGGKNNTFLRNNFTSNTGVGIKFYVDGDGNRVYLNRFTSNGGGNAADEGAFNHWDNGSVGNFWHDYSGKDENDDGIGDTVWPISGSAGSNDNYPLWRDANHPLHIIGNEGWAACRAAGNCTGSGTENDPYVLSERWYYGGWLTSCVWIENSSVFFTTNDCKTNGSDSWPHAGIRLTNVTNGRLIQNDFSTNQGPGIYLENNCSSISILNNRANHNPYGILSMGGSKEISIINNLVTGSTGMGVVLSDDQINITLTGNNFSYNVGSGLRLVNRCTNITIRGNIFSYNTMEGVYLSDCNFTLVEGNNVTRNQVGMSLDTSARNNWLLKNNVLNNTRGVYCRASSNNTIGENLIINNTGEGIYLDWGTANNSYNLNSVIQNINGIVFASGVNTNHTFFANIVANNSQYGIRVRTGGDGNLFYNNTFCDNNHANASDDAAFNRWDNGSLGNLYGDYAGVDLDDDCVGDTPYSINGTAGEVDYHPIWNDGDDAAPALAVISPASGQVNGALPPLFEVSMHDLTLAVTGYTLNSVNTTFSGTDGIINSGIWDPLLNGTYVVTFFANDSFGRWSIVPVTIHKDIEVPVFTSTDLTLGQLHGNNTPAFVLAASEGNPTGLWWLSFDGGATNTSCSQSDILTGWDLLPNGTVTVRFFTNDTVNNVGWIDVSLERDCAPPVISSTGLTAGASFTNAPAFSLSIAEANRQAVWYSVDGGATNHTLAGLTGSIDAAVWAVLATGDVIITFWANDTLGNTASVMVVIVKTTSGGDCEGCEDPTLYWIIGGIIAAVMVVGIGIIVKKRKKRAFYPDETPASE